MSILVIGQTEQAHIDAALARARANVVPWARLKDFVRVDPVDVMRLQDRPPGFERPVSEHIMLGTYRAAVSFEEQPAGIFKHLSVSSHNKGRVPGLEVMEMVCEAFGFSAELCRFIANPRGHRPPHSFRLWLEEFEPGHIAVNVIELEP